MSYRIVDEYEKNLRKYLVRKHQYSKKSENDRKNRVIKFLKFCSTRGKKTIKDIEQADFDRFMDEIKDLSTETRRKYRLALREFFTRAHLNIRVNVQKATRLEKEKKFERLKEILKDCDCIEQYKDKILEIL